MLQQLKALLSVLFQSPTFYICVISILYFLHTYISDGIRRCWDPRRTERPPSLDASSSSSTNPQDTPSLDASSASSTNPRDNHDVFLSFRGETGKTFTSHLYNGLDLKGIYTFLDVKRLERGEDISRGLDNAIEGSRCAVVILSGNYTSSRWCMDELVQILKCRNDSKIKQIVLPIFYHVNPDDILKDKGTIWEGFQSLKREFPNNQEKVKTWRDALIQLANIAGHHVHQGTNEATFIEEFVKMVSSKLFDAALLNIPKDLVGMDSRLERLKLCVSRSSCGDVRFIGICGMGGLGKTTLARAYLKYMSGQFQASSFLANVRGVCEKEHDDGLVRLQKQLLTDVLKVEHSVNNVDEGKGMIRRRLCGKKILLVLDDVDQLMQLEGLAEENNWFGDGSQIIVTTRDESLLPGQYEEGEYIIHKIDKLEDSEALQLFSLKAFKSDCPPGFYGELSTKVIEYASGLPLALVILGSFLRKKTRDQWKNALDRLKEYPKNEIMRVLRISFDGLEETEKNIFLDIACFFNGSPKDEVMNIMDSCGFFPEIGIRSLVDKSLLGITEEYDYLMRCERSILRMHDLLEEMGKEIVREKSREEPGKRSRIWLADEISHVLNNEKEMEEVEAIVCPDTKQRKDFKFRGFSNVKNLRLLITTTTFYTIEVGPDNEYLPNKLRFLKWEGFPFESFPRSFQPHGLVELTLKNSRIRRLWDNPEMEPLSNLKSIDLSDSSEIRKLENFSLFPNLEKLILYGCQALEEIDPSITDLKRLTLLSLEWCNGLKSLLTRMAGLKSLKSLNLSWYSSLGNFSEGFVRSDEELDVTGHELQSHEWKNIWNTIAGLSCLERLYLAHCNLPDGGFPDDFGCLVSLEYLDLRSSEFSCLPAHFNRLSKLKLLNLNYCGNLTSLGPELPDSLERIYVNRCEELHTFLDPLSQCNLQCSAIYCFDCRKLVNRQGSKRTSITSLGRYLQNSPKSSKRFDIVLPGNKIPSWFTHKVMGSSSISLPLDQNWCTNKWMGFALSVCLTTRGHYPFMEDWFWDIKINQEDWGFGQVRWAGEVQQLDAWETELDNDSHIWLLYLPRDAYFHTEWHNKKFDHIQFSFKSIFEYFEENVECGVRLVYEGEIQELNITARNETYDTEDEDDDDSEDEDDDEEEDELFQRIE